MDENLPFPGAALTGEAAPSAHTIVFSATCPVMRVTYVPSTAAVEDEHTRDAVEIVIAADDVVFYASYRSTGDNRPSVQETIRTCARNPADMVVIALDRTFYQNTTGISSGSGAPLFKGCYCAADALVRELGNALLRDFRTRRIPSSAYLESLAGVIAVHLATHHCVGTVLPAARGLPRHKLQRVLRFIYEHIDRAIHVDELAATAYVSPHHFARMFKEATGVPPHRYITLQRIDHAKRLLTETDLPLVDVAAAVGFQTQGHFTSVFRKHAGVTPRTFRLACPAAANGRQSYDASCLAISTEAAGMAGPRV
jgi:AraC family transcriptional regulator